MTRRVAPDKDGPTAAAELRGVVKAFGGRPALAGLDLVVPRGSFLALLGPNGAGKTTALSLLLGLRVPERGEALLLGRPPVECGIRRRIGATPQLSAFPSGLKVREVVAFVAAHYSDPMPEDWTERYSTTPVLIETFVETPRYTGAVYRASGWIPRRDHPWAWALRPAQALRQAQE